MNDYRADVETLDIYNKREKESAREAEYVVSGLFSGCGTGRVLLGIGMETKLMPVITKCTHHQSARYPNGY